MLAKKENIESILNALNEAIEDKDIALINSIVFHLGNKYSKDCDSIILLNQNKTQNKESNNFKTVIELKKQEEIKPTINTNIKVKNQNNVFFDRDIQINQQPNNQSKMNLVNSNYINKQYEQQQTYQQINNVFDNSNNSNVFGQQNVFQSQYDNNNSNNNPYRGNTNMTNTKIVQENVFSNSNNQNYVGNQNTQLSGYQNINVKKPNTNLILNDRFNPINTNLNMNNQYSGNNKINHTQFNNINQYPNQFIQGKNSQNNQRMNSCPDNLNDIEEDFYDAINDYESFYYKMGCRNQKDEVLISCNQYHQFGCLKCLANYYKKKYPQLNQILIDPFICPICKNSSSVESSHEILKYVFGSEVYRKLQ